METPVPYGAGVFYWRATDVAWRLTRTSSRRQISGAPSPGANDDPDLARPSAYGQPAATLSFWLVAVALAVWTWTSWLIVAVLYGVVLQFFVEYAMHRFLLHRKPPTEQGIFNQLYRSHIGHHEFPADPELFAGDNHWYPVRFGLISVALHTAVLWPFLGPQTAFAFAFLGLFLGSVSAFAIYAYFHTLAHLNVPKGWIGQKITRDHLAHHYQDHHATYHVSLGMGWIDRLFGTPHDPEAAKARFDRKTILSMGMDAEDLRLVTACKAHGLPPWPGMKRARSSE